MKKRSFARIVCCIFAFCCFLFASACKDEEQTGAIDYNASVLVVSQTDTFAPCSFNEFYAGNTHTQKYFEELNKTAISDKYRMFYVTIDGKEWTAVELHTEDLPQGTYRIVIETREECTIVKLNSDGTRVKVPYVKKLTLSVSVSSAYEDKYSLTEE